MFPFCQFVWLKSPLPYPLLTGSYVMAFSQSMEPLTMLLQSDSLGTGLLRSGPLGPDLMLLPSGSLGTGLLGQLPRLGQRSLLPLQLPRLHLLQALHLSLRNRSAGFPLLS